MARAEKVPMHGEKWEKHACIYIHIVSVNRLDAVSPDVTFQLRWNGGTTSFSLCFRFVDDDDDDDNM